MHKFKLASRMHQAKKTILSLPNQVQIGGDQFTVIAGPCSIESEEQIEQIAAAVSKAGAHILRGGAFKPRTSPYDFQGLGETGLAFLKQAAQRHGLLTVSEVMDVSSIDLVASYVDIVQVGSRNMQNFSLLKQLGSIRKPILLKRGFAATYHEFLLAAEYILEAGNSQVILCERGIRSFETHTRHTLDIAAVPVLQALSHLPIIVDPSHATGLRDIVPSMAYASLAAGADGLMVEVHTDPEQSISDASQTITPATFTVMMNQLHRLNKAMKGTVNTDF